MLENLFSKRTQRPIWNWIILGCTLANTIVFGIILAGAYLNFRDVFSFSGTIGDTLGPIVGFVGVILIYITYNDQRETNDFNASTYFTSLLMEELNRIKEEIPLVEFEGHKGKNSVIQFLSKMNKYQKYFDGGPDYIDKKNRVWEIEFHEYINNLIFLLSKIHDEYLKIDNLNLDKRLKETLIFKIDELIYRYLGDYHEVWDEVSNDISEVKSFEKVNEYDNLKIHDINILIKLQIKYERYLNKFVEDKFVLLMDRNSSFPDDISNPKIDFEKINKLNLNRVYRLPKVISN